MGIYFEIVNPIDFQLVPAGTTYISPKPNVLGDKGSRDFVRALV